MMINFFTNNKYLRLLCKLSMLLVILFLLDYSIGNVMRYYYFRQKSGKQFRTTYIMEQVKSDILILGSSRANHHYHPDVFENELGVSFYNAGRDGNFMFYHYAVLKSVLKRYKPDIVILDILRDEFTVDQISYDRLSSLLPYYRHHPEIRPLVELRSPYEKIKLVSSIYPYNSSIFTIIAGNLGIGSEIGRENKGYVSITKTIEGPVHETLPEQRKTDPRKIEVFESFIKDCKSAGVRLFIICSPYYTSVENTETVETAGNIAGKYDIPFFDFSNEATFAARPDLFADYWHLNDDGARLFSAVIAKKIREEIAIQPDKKNYMTYKIPVIMKNQND